MADRGSPLPTSASAPAASSPQAPGADAPPSRRAWLIAFLLFAFMVINFADKAVLGLAAKPLTKELGLSSSEYGLIAGAFFLLFNVSAVAGGFIADRVSGRWFLLVMAVAWSLAQLPVAAAAGFGVLLAGRLVLGATEGPAVPVATHTLYQWFPAGARTRPTALLTAGAPLGVVAAAPLLGALISAHGWRSAFLAVAAVGAVWAVLWFVLGRDRGRPALDAPGPKPAAEAPSSPRVGYRQVLTSRTFLANTGVAFAGYWSAGLLLSFVPSYLEDVLGRDAAEAGRLVALPWALSALSLLVPAFLVPWMLRRGVSGRIANSGLSAVTSALSGLCLIGLAYGPAGSARIVFLAVGFSVATVVFPLALTSFGTLAPARLRGGAIGVYTGVYSVAGVVSPVVAGRLLDVGGHDAHGYATVFLLAAVLQLGGAAAVGCFSHPERDALRLAATFRQDAPPPGR
ncbi:MFS transporter [Streptomyces sp. SID8379]|uniref:MFS transporter n=1 Tax=unclassified Streptomyces TaxID=2593676 RepID=UPI00036CF036|nr:MULTISPECIES: MFS transporter [unclassified Streptomyces]MYW69862.1 MFS transporter [Streptomyces sp. SID8379]